MFKTKNKIENELNRMTLEARIRFLKRYVKDWWELVFEKSIKPFYKESVYSKFLKKNGK